MFLSLKPLHFTSFAALSVLLGSPLVSAQTLPPGIYPNLRHGDTLIPPVASYLGKDIVAHPLPVTPEMLQEKSNFGYSEDEIRQYFSTPITMYLDESGINKGLLKTPPAPGVHPRVLFNPEDVDVIRQNLTQTEAGKSIMADIRAHIDAVLTGPKATFSAEYTKLSQGDATVNFTKDNNANIGYTLMYEAFRCLIDKDEEGGKKVAAAIATIAPLCEKAVADSQAKESSRPASNNPDPFDFRNMGLGPTLQGTLGLDYDFAYNFMSDNQRDVVRHAIVKATAGMSTQGAASLLHWAGSNWVPWSDRLIFLICSIEGEPGYDAKTYDHAIWAQTSYINALFPTGEGYEGWGKSFMFMEHMIALGKRGQNIIASTSIRSAYNDYFVASMNPWGNAFTFCDSLGGTGNKISRNADVMIYHNLFPNDLSGDFIYRNQISGDYANVAPGHLVNTHHPFSVMDSLCCAIFASDMMPGKTWDSELAEVTNGRPLSYFSEDTCNMITRSAWDKNALYLNYLTRAIPGGHVYCDRSHFSLYGLGRYWSIYHFMRQVHEQYLPMNRSVMLADGRGASIAEGKCVNYTDVPGATFTATDLSIAWDYQTKSMIPPPSGTEMVKFPFSFNDFRLHASPLPWKGMPIADLPNWYTSNKPTDEKPEWYKTSPQVTKAFRTAGLVRGPHPYCLIVDDMQLDDKVHAWDWGMILADDLVLGSAQTTGDAANPMADIVLNETGDPKMQVTGSGPIETDRHLLVRVMQASQLDPKTPATVGFYAVPNPPQKDWQINKLHIPSQSVSPNFKILMFPFKDGQALPTTTWNASRTEVTVAWPDQVDQITFSPGNDGRNRINIVRGGSPLANVQ